MSQSGFIAAALLAGFVLFLAGRGRLATYAAVLWGPAPAAPASGGSGGSGDTLAAGAHAASKALPFMAQVAAFFGA